MATGIDAVCLVKLIYRIRNRFWINISEKEVEIPMNNSDLQELVLSLMEQGKEGEYWDFKQEWHDDIADLLKDIICFANSVHS